MSENSPGTSTRCSSLLKNVANKLLYSEDEAEQLDLAEQMKSMIVTVEQIKIFGAVFNLKTMRTFTKGKSGEIIRKLYRRYNRALVQLDITEGDEEVEEAKQNLCNDRLMS